MKKPQGRRAFTLIELLVVVAIIALLIAILLPSLQRAREQGRKAKCSANLHNLGQAAHQYAEEDQYNQLMPVHKFTVTPLGPGGGFQPVSRGASWFAWGGRGATEEFLTSASKGIFLNENRKAWGASERPMTKFMYPTVSREEKNLPAFQCPSDRGYYGGYPTGVIDDLGNVEGNLDKVLYNIIGNSYRGSLAGWGPDPAGRYSIGILGQRSDKILETSRMIWGGEPMFYAFIGTDATRGFGQVKDNGWHGDFMSGVEVFADGSARSTRAVAKDDPSYQFSSSDLDKMGIQNGQAGLMTRGPNWKIDCYPNPGARYGSIQPFTPDASKWPQKNLLQYPLPEDDGGTP